MTIIEGCLVTIAASAVVAAIVAIIAFARLMPFLREAENTLREAQQTLRRLDHITADLEGMTRDTRRLEQRVAVSVEALMNEVEPPLRWLADLLRGIRAGVGAFVQPPPERPAVPEETHPTEANLPERSQS